MFMQHRPDTLFTNTRPIGGPFDGSQILHLEIRQGKIVAWHDPQSSSAPTDLPTQDMQGAYVSPGWMDMHVHLREPGFEHKETIETGCAAAAFGGFTAVACMPNTNPPIHTRDVVEYIIRKSERLPVAVHPIACVSKDRKGKQITEMADLKQGGAVAFSDDGDPVYDARLMRVALEYASMLDMPIINHEEDLSLSRPGHMNESAVSTRLGLQGTPAIAEEVMIARDILLAQHTGGHVHVAHISTKGAVDLVRQAKARGIKVTTEVCPHHFDLTDEEIDRRHFDTNCKMHPPLRTEEDRLAMIEGLLDGTIDAICTDHAPHAIEEKEVEFIYAPNGILGLETAWPLSVRRLLNEAKMPLKAILDCLIKAPREILRLPVPSLDKGAEAELTFFNTDETWTYQQKHIKSKSINTPYLGESFKGRAVGIYNRSQFVHNSL
jgi:dihydroorotase